MGVGVLWGGGGGCTALIKKRVEMHTRVRMACPYLDLYYDPFGHMQKLP